MRVVLDLAADGDPEEVRRYLREVATDLSELEQLVDDIIVGSRLEMDPDHWSAAEPPLRRRRTTIVELVEATAARFRSRWPERELVCRLPEERIAVDVDPVLVRRALDNLLDNARKYSPDDRAVVLSVERDAGGGVRLAVVDHGVGIAPEDQPRVFTPFFRADPSRSRATGGVGLGLVLARRIIESHGGSIGFTSAHESGSTFWLTLPAE
jgi:signal transduction histidine kinase